MPWPGDVTETKEVQKAIIAKEERFRGLAENSPLGIALNDMEGKILYLNPAFTQTFGYTLEDLPNVDHWWALAYPDEDYRRETKKYVDGNEFTLP